jgi:dolichol-phosphate mannosyltransferase
MTTAAPRLLSVIIPAMNEEQTIRPVLVQYAADLRKGKIPFELVVVNDVGADNTAAVLRQLGGEIPELRAFNRKGGGGYGSAVVLGIEKSHGDYVVISSADECNTSEDVIRYYETLERGNDAVFGSRFIPGGSVTDYPLFKLFVNRASNFLLQIFFGFKFNDYTDGFKGYRRKLLQQCKPFFSTKFNITIELSLKAMLLTDRIEQIPTRWYGRHWGDSKLSILKVLRYYISSLLFVLGLRVVGDEFRRTANGTVEIEEVVPPASRQKGTA